jgi:alkanesulfonate monooxygenase SsuD/methylene tetrahydromethanopterin reductase-like flavin-dependent oxidoreductase (luciferase family)
MKFGVTLPITGVDGDVRQIAECAALAEQCGWDAVWIEDYIISFGGAKEPVFDPWLAMTAAALATKKIRIAITVTPLARRRPWKVAREAVTLDHLSNGRLILGVGVGMSEDASFANFGEAKEVKQRSEMLDEALEILAGLWSGKPFHFEGKHYKVTESTFFPTPVQKPRIPIWIGGGWPRKQFTARAMRWDGACPFKVDAKGNMDMLSAADVREMKATLEAGRKNGAPLDIVVGGGTGNLSKAAAAAQTKPLADAGATWWSEMTSNKGAALRKRIQQGPPRFD